MSVSYECVDEFIYIVRGRRFEERAVKLVVVKSMSNSA